MKRPMPKASAYPETIVFDGLRCAVQCVEIQDLAAHLKREDLEVLPPRRDFLDFEWGGRWWPVLLVTRRKIWLKCVPNYKTRWLNDLDTS